MIAFMLIDHLVPSVYKKQIAETILLAQKLREESYNENHEYNLSYEDATTNAIVKMNLPLWWTDIIYNLIKYSWNDSHDWANTAINNQ